MYTQCPECKTFFRVTAANLSAANGEVCCGACDIEFNALQSLTDDLPRSVAGIPDNRSYDDDRGEIPDIPFENNDRGEIPDIPFENNDRDEIPDEQLEDNDQGEIPVSISRLEYETWDPDEWKALLNEVPDDASVQDTDDPERNDHITRPSDNEPSNDRKEEPTDEAASLGTEEIIVFGPDSDDIGSDSETMNNGGELIRDPVPISASFSPQYARDARPVDEQVADAGDGTEESSDLHRWLTEDLEPEESIEIKAAPASRGLFIVALILALTLIGQLLHYNRDALAADPEYGGLIRGLYGRVRSSLYPEWGLNSFEVRGTEVVASAMPSSTLNILAKVLIVGDQPVGMPLIRVELHDRWSDPVASGVFKPSEYLGEQDQRPQMLVPGTMLPVRISVTDPGAEARSYVVDVCLPSRKAGLVCQSARDPFK